MTNTKNTTGRAKFDTIARDFRVATVRQATTEECEGDHSFVMVELAEGCTLEGSSKFLAAGVVEMRNLLDAVEISEGE